jgi:hypothetical protein
MVVTNSNDHHVDQILLQAKEIEQHLDIQKLDEEITIKRYKNHSHEFIFSIIIVLTLGLTL